MKTPTVEQLQAWTKQWEEAKHYLSYQKVFDQRLHQSQQARDTAEISQVMDDLVNQVGQGELGKDPTEVEQVVGELVDQVEGQDQQAKNLQKAQVTGIVAGEHIATLRNELGRALEDLGLEPPWSARNSTSGLYRTDEHVIPLAIRLLDGLRLSKASGYADFAEEDHAYGCKSPFAYSHLAVKTNLTGSIQKNPKQADWLYHQALLKQVDMKQYVDELTIRLFNLNVDIMKTPGEKKNDVKNAIYEEVEQLIIRTDANDLADIDADLTEKTTRLVDRLIENNFSTWNTQLTDWQNAELQLKTQSKIEQIIKQFNQEKRAIRHLNDSFDLAFCTNASESDQSAARLQALKDSGIKNIPGVLRGASVDSARELYNLAESDDQEVLVEIAERAAKISSYGLLRAATEAMDDGAYFSMKSKYSMVLTALSGCDPSVIKQCLKIKSDIFVNDYPASNQFLLLKTAVDEDIHSAETRSGEDRLQMLLDVGVDINAPAFSFLTGAHTLILDYCESGKIDEAKRLIHAGADVNIMGPDSKTALMETCDRGYEEIVKELIAAGADVNIRGDNGVTALMIACKKGYEGVVRELIYAGADLDILDRNYETARNYAKRSGNDTITNFMISLQLITAASCEQEFLEDIEDLIDAGADVNIRGKNGETPLMMACKAGNITAMEVLIKAGAKDDHKDNNNKTALDYAKDSKNPTVIAFMTQHITRRRENRLMASEDMHTTAGQAQTEGVYTASNPTTQALTELTTAAIEIGRQIGYGPGL